MIRMHNIPGPVNHDIDYTCSAYRYSLRTPTKRCSTHYTYEAMITKAIVDFFQQPVDEIILQVINHSPVDRSGELEAARVRLEKTRKKKVEAIKLRLEYPSAGNEFEQVITELSQTEVEIQKEIAELEMNQIRLPDISGIRSWIGEMLSIENLGDWLANDDPEIIRAVLGQRIRVLCYQRKYKSLEPAPTVELCL